MSSTGSPVIQPDATTGGSETAVGTDAYTTFHGFAGVPGVIYYGSSSGWSVTATFTGMDPAKTYTFATTANRNDAAYTARISKYTISGIDAATNASTAGVTKTTTTITEDTSSFLTGYNTVNGYVARWTGIQPGADGSFAVTATFATTEYRAYAFSVFLLSEEITTTDPTISITGTLAPFSSTPGVASAEQSYSVSGVNLTTDLVITAPADFQISTTIGQRIWHNGELNPHQRDSGQHTHLCAL